MFLKARLKSSNPQTRMKAIREMVWNISQEQGRPKAFDWLIEQARAETNPALTWEILGQVDEARRFIAIASDEAESDAFRVIALRAFADRMHSRARSRMEAGEPAEAQRLLDVLADECRPIAESNASEEVRAAAREAMADPEPIDLAAALAKRPSAEEVVRLLLAERDPVRIDILAAYLKGMSTPKGLSGIEGAFAMMMSRRDAYPSETVRHFTNLYSNWAGITTEEARLKYMTQDDLERLKAQLYGDNVMENIRALDELQKLWRVGKFRHEIGRMTYNGQPVATYKDPNAGNIITAPTH